GGGGAAPPPAPRKRRGGARGVGAGVPRAQPAAGGGGGRGGFFPSPSPRRPGGNPPGRRAPAGRGLTPPRRVLKAFLKPIRSSGSHTSSRRLLILRKEKCSISNLESQISDLESSYDRRRRRRHSRNFAGRTRDRRIRRALHQPRLHRTRNRLLRAGRPQSRTLCDSLRRERGRPESPRRRHARRRALLA